LGRFLDMPFDRLRDREGSAGSAGFLVCPSAGSGTGGGSPDSGGPRVPFDKLRDRRELLRDRRRLLRGRRRLLRGRGRSPEREVLRVPFDEHADRNTSERTSPGH
jgi:hypothetical protein